MNKIDLSELISELNIDNTGCISPILAIFKQGDSEDTLNYINSIQKKAQKKNVRIIICDLENLYDSEVKNKINEIQNLANAVLPVRPFSDDIEKIILSNIDPLKDIDNFSRLGIFKNCTAEGVLKVLEYLLIPIDSRITILGRHIGMDIHKTLIDNNYTSTVCHSKTPNTFKYTSSSDVIISCTGVKNLLDKDNVKKGSLVIDVGLGDAASNVSEVARVTQIRNGVGAITSQILFRHIFDSVKAFRIRQEIHYINDVI